ncbi:MAG: GTPase ObgE [Actinomycetota bacterium]|nr:GTPase ObgE [Actinomycetota bacterium]
MFHDRARIWVEGGAGGNGVVSFRREAHVPRGGPDGGDGGRGGDVVLVCDSSRRDLAALRIARHFKAGRGRHGEGARRHGARGETLEVSVPPGTSAEGVDGASYDLVEPGQRAVVAAGGGGGHGNKRFATSTRQAPRFSEKGLAGEEGWIELRLRLLADAGLVGLPNAGKSSLLARLTNARPKVADYPFTTIEPILGTIENSERQLVLADIPGLIEGAADGAGMGHEFLAHVERCRVLVHVLEVDPPDGAPEPAEAYRTVRAELDAYGAGLADLPEIVLFSKLDLLPPDGAEEWVAELADSIGAESTPVLAGSSATGEGIEALIRALFGAVPAAPPADVLDSDAGEYEAEYITYRPAADQGFEVLRENEAFRVVGKGIELLVARHDLSNLEALTYLEDRLREIGVVAALERAGFAPGDDVRIGSEEFEFHPG